MIRRLAAGVGANIFDKAIVAGTQLAMVPTLAAHWGLHLYGLWVLLATIPSFLAMGDLGFATAAGTKMTMAEARGDRAQVIRTFQSAWAAILASTAVLVTVAVAVSLLLPMRVFGADPGLAAPALRATLLLLLLYGVAVIQGSIFFAGFRCAGLFAVGAFWNAMIILIESGAAIFAVAIGGAPPAAAAALLGGRLIGLAGQNMLLRRRVPWLKIGVRGADRAEVRMLLKPAGAVMLLPLAQAMSLQGTAIALGLAAGQAAVPAFTAARTLSRIGLQMCWLLNSAMMPEASAAIARNDRRALAMMVLATLAASAALVVPFALLFALFGREAILLWTHGVIHSPAPLIVAMAASVLFGGFWFPMSNLILAANRHAGYTLAFVALAALALPAGYLLSRSLGATGAGVTMAGLDLVMFVVIAVLAQRILVPARTVIGAAPDARRYVTALVRRVTGTA